MATVRPVPRDAGTNLQVTRNQAGVSTGMASYEICLASPGPSSTRSDVSRTFSPGSSGCGCAAPFSSMSKPCARHETSFGNAPRFATWTAPRAFFVNSAIVGLTCCARAVAQADTSAAGQAISQTKWVMYFIALLSFSSMGFECEAAQIFPRMLARFKLKTHPKPECAGCSAHSSDQNSALSANFSERFHRHPVALAVHYPHTRNQYG